MPLASNLNQAIKPRLQSNFFVRNPVTIARALLGQRLVRVLDSSERLAGTIVETEAYLGTKDKAAHTCNGRRTPRNESMWQQGGTLYVYFTYGMHHCANVVASTKNDPVAVLIRAVEPTQGLAAMYKHRGPAAKTDRDLCSGPARMCQAFALDRTQDGDDLVTSKSVYIEQMRKRALPSRLIQTTPRIGINYAQEWTEKPLRFFIKNNPHVSKR
jgi:DNA-3-methyladenine glycosylase